MNQLLKYIFLAIFPFVWTACSQGVEEEDTPSATPFPGLGKGEVGFGIVGQAGIPGKEEDYRHSNFIHNKSYLRIYNNTGSTLDFTDDADYKWYVYDDSLSVRTGGNYNFRPLGGRGFLWSELKISTGYGYIFDAVVFPHFQKYKNTVSINQNKSEEFLASDILMAHHVQGSEDVGKKVALKFFHVLSMLKIDIYVPKYDAATNTGFPKDSLSDVVLPNLYTKFKFDASSSVSSDAAPTVTTEKENQATISMLSLDDAGLTKIEEGNDSGKGEGEAHNCYIYHYAAILPVQAIGDNTELIRLKLKTKDGISKAFSYKPKPAGGSQSNISFEAGKITNLKLAINEEGNKAFLIKAEVQPWEDARTDMSLEKEEESNP